MLFHNRKTTDYLTTRAVILQDDSTNNTPIFRRLCFVYYRIYLDSCLDIQVPLTHPQDQRSQLTVKSPKPNRMCNIYFKNYACCRPGGHEAHATYMFNCKTEVYELVPAGQCPKTCPSVQVYTFRLEDRDLTPKCQNCSTPAYPIGPQEPHNCPSNDPGVQRTTLRILNPRVSHDDSSHFPKTDLSPTPVSVSATEGNPPISTETTVEPTHDSLLPEVNTLPTKLESLFVSHADVNSQQTPRALGDFPSNEPLFLPNGNLPPTLTSFFVGLANAAQCLSPGQRQPLPLYRIKVPTGPSERHAKGEMPAFEVVSVPPRSSSLVGTNRRGSLDYSRCTTGGGGGGNFAER